MKSACLEIKEGKVTQGINQLLKRLLQEKLVDALLVMTELNSKKDVAPALITEPDMLTQACPLTPVMPVSLARVVSSLTRVSSGKRKIGVVLRPCELRALVELVKLKQASLDNLVLISMDCPGTYSTADYRKYSTEHTVDDIWRQAKNGEALNIREACQVCEHFTPMNADLVIGLMGVDLNRQVLIEAMTKKGEAILDALRLTAGVAKGRETAIAALRAERTGNKEKLWERFGQGMAGLDKLTDVFASCTNCHNCRVACPICYCKQCFMESPTFEWEADKYLSLAEKKGALRLPADTLLFHLTRMTHVGVSCVGCGLCQDACPEGIPLFPLFRRTADEVQKLFEYTPGQNLDEEPPLTVFQQDELKWVEES